jgi:peptidylprolyl isomerase
MNQTTTGIVVALAVAVVAIFFMYPGLSPFGSPQSSAATATQPVATTTNPAITASSTPTTMTTSDGLEITDEVVGTGATAAAGDSVTVNYVGALTNGTVFDASANHGTTGFTFTLGTNPPQVIQGWDEGIVGMKVGGTRELVIPAALAYGSQSPSPAIPANSTLVFQVQLLSVTPAQ